MSYKSPPNWKLQSSAGWASANAFLRSRIAHDYGAEGGRVIAKAAFADTPALLLTAERARRDGRRLAGV